jgi:hypothetical protein
MDRGWTPIGATHVVTKALDNMLVEIDAIAYHA